MQVDYSLILSAGFGSRMGEIGKILPKPIWPLFESNLLTIQKKFLEDLFSPKSFYANIHHQAEKIEPIAESLEIETLYEKDILGSGGGIYNLVNQLKEDGLLLTHNGDQFCFFSKEVINQAFELLESHPIVLFGIELPKELNHNGLSIDENNYIKSLKPNEDFEKKVLTYSGTGLFKTTCIERKEGIQNFFGSLADFRNRKIPLLLDSNAEYLDFGTLARFRASIEKVLVDENSSLRKFLLKNGFMKEERIGDNSYHSNKKFCFNFSKENIPGAESSIYLSESKDEYSNMIYFENMRESLK